MMAPDRITRTITSPRTMRVAGGCIRQWLAAGVLAACLVGLGCKSKDSKASDLRANDPLVVGPGKIPRQNLPIPDRGTAGAKGQGDPLLSAPVSRPGQSSGSSYNDADPARVRGASYILGPSGTPAALAGRLKDEGDELRIPVVTGVPLTRGDGTTSVGPITPLPPELARYGVKRSDYTVVQSGQQFVVEVRVSIENGARTRGYKGTGPSEAAALEQVLEQIRAE
jgi:hypothetical protein